MKSLRQQIEEILGDLCATVHEAVSVRDDMEMRDRAYAKATDAILQAVREAVPEKKPTGLAAKAFGAEKQVRAYNQAIDEFNSRIEE